MRPSNLKSWIHPWLTNDFNVSHVQFDNKVPIVQNINLMPNRGPCPDININAEFLSNFEDNNELNNAQKNSLGQLLCDNKDICVAKDNPSLGLTDVVEHHIVIQPDFRPLHQKPYRLTPHRKEVLRHHLEELLEQGVISELSAKEEAPITSPVVLVTKRSKHSSGKPLDRASSLQQFRFCVDFRYLNSHTETFKYFVPYLQELTNPSPKEHRII